MCSTVEAIVQKPAKKNPWFDKTYPGKRQFDQSIQGEKQGGPEIGGYEFKFWCGGL